MDIIQEALHQLNMSERTGSDVTAGQYIDRARVLSTLAIADQVGRIADRLIKSDQPAEDSPAKRIVITFNDDTTQDQIDTLSQAITLMQDQLKITAVIIYENGE